MKQDIANLVSSITGTVGLFSLGSLVPLEILFSNSI